MRSADNLFESTKYLINSDSVRKVSEALREPQDKVHAGLQSIVPTLVNELILEGSTSRGAKKIVHLVQNQEFNPTLPKNLNDQDYLSQGEHVVEDIFGGKHSSLASSLTPGTGLTVESMEKMMEMVAPVVMGFIGSKVKDEGLNARELNGFFLEQKSFSDPPSRRKKLPFSGAVALGALIIVGSFWIFSGKNPQVSTMTRELAALERSVSNSPNTPSNGLSISDLPAFLASDSKSELPKRFIMNNLQFQSGTTDILSGSDRDLNLIAENLRRYPKASAKIEAYVEETGDPDENLLLSENRAMLVREELIGRGIEPSRIRAEGRGPRGDKRQAYLVITLLK